MFTGSTTKAKIIRIVGKDAVEFFNRTGLSDIQPTEEESQRIAMGQMEEMVPGPRFPVDVVEEPAKQKHLLPTSSCCVPRCGIIARAVGVRSKPTKKNPTLVQSRIEGQPFSVFDGENGYCRAVRCKHPLEVKGDVFLSLQIKDARCGTPVSSARQDNVRAVSNACDSIVDRCLYGRDNVRSDALIRAIAHRPEILDVDDVREPVGTVS